MLRRFFLAPKRAAAAIAAIAAIKGPAFTTLLDVRSPQFLAFDKFPNRVRVVQIATGSGPSPERPLAHFELGGELANSFC
jgi:hypothetical protein